MLSKVAFNFRVLIRLRGARMVGLQVSCLASAGIVQRTAIRSVVMSRKDAKRVVISQLAIKRAGELYSLIN